MLLLREHVTNHRNWSCDCKHIVACRAVSRQLLGKHVPSATDTHIITEVLLETVFSTRSVKMGYKEDNCSSEIESEGKYSPHILSVNCFLYTIICRAVQFDYL
jgi:hypothetical protein